MSLFWYTRVNEGKEYLDAINLQKVIRAITVENEELLVLLDDIHERIQEVPLLGKNGKVNGTKNTRGTFQTEVYLSKEDAKRFYELTNKQE